MNVCKIESNGSTLKFDDPNGEQLIVDIFSNGETTVRVSNEACLLSNRAAHELRDFLNRRFPNATAVQ